MSAAVAGQCLTQCFIYTYVIVLLLHIVKNILTGNSGHRTEVSTNPWQTAARGMRASSVFAEWGWNDAPKANPKAKLYNHSVGLIKRNDIFTGEPI